MIVKSILNLSNQKVRLNLENPEEIDFKTRSTMNHKQRV